MFQNLSKLFSTKSRIFIYIILVLMAWGVWWYFTDVAIMVGNYGKLHTYIDVMLSIMLIVWFPLFLLGFWYKVTLFGQQSITGKSSTGMIGGLIGTIISGASCCGATLAVYFGLLPLLTALPYSGLEIKILGTLGLLYALYDVLKNLEICEVKS